MKQGHTMEVPFASSQTWVPAFTGRYDDEEIVLISQFVLPDSLVLDIGACFGFYSVPLARVSGSLNSVVVAFEPIAGNRAILRKNAALNGVEASLSILPFALGSTHETARAGVETSGVGNSALVVEQAEEFGPHDSYEEVEIQRLDDVSFPSPCKNRKCSIMKLDVEGYEMPVLHGAETFIAKHRPIIFGEFSKEWQRVRGIEENSPLSWSSSHDYSCYELQRSRRRFYQDVFVLAPVPAGHESSRMDNLLMIPAERAELDDELKEANGKISGSVPPWRRTPREPLDPSRRRSMESVSLPAPSRHRGSPPRG